MGVFGRASAVGCFGIRFIVGLAQFSYNSKNVFAEGQQPPLILAEPPLTFYAELCHRRSGWRCSSGWGPAMLWLR